MLDVDDQISFICGQAADDDDFFAIIFPEDFNILAGVCSDLVEENARPFFSLPGQVKAAPVGKDGNTAVTREREFVG